MSQKSQWSNNGGTDEDLIWFIALSSLACIIVEIFLHPLYMFPPDSLWFYPNFQQGQKYLNLSASCLTIEV